MRHDAVRAEAATCPFFAVEGVTKRYGAVTALDGVSLGVAEGEFLTLLGPSGSGKTTLLMCVAGFERPDAGRLRQGGRDVTDEPPEARRHGMVFQGYALFPHMSVAENVAFPLRVAGTARRERRERVAQMLEMVGLDGLGARRPAQLSGGQQQRVALARALAPSPAMILLDEPLSALDKNLRERMQGEIRALHREAGATFVFVTHDQDEALSMSDRVAIFDGGRLRQVGAPRDVYERPTDRFVAEFLGRANLVPLDNAVVAGGWARGRFEGCEIAARTDRPAIDEPMAVVRPEDARLVRGPEEGLNAVEATVEGVSYGGARLVVQARSRSGVELVVELGGAARSEPPRPGEPVWIAWPRDAGFAIPATP